MKTILLCLQLTLSLVATRTFAQTATAEKRLRVMLNTDLTTLDWQKVGDQTTLNNVMEGEKPPTECDIP